MAQTLEELMKMLPPVSPAYSQDVYAPMREFQDFLQNRPQVDVAPFFQAMQQENQGAPVPQMSVPSEVNPLQAFFSLLGGNLAAQQSGNQAYAQGPLSTIQHRQEERTGIQRSNEQARNQALQQDYEKSRALKLKMHEMQMQQAIQRGDLALAAKENEARFKMLDLQRQEDAKLAQANADRELMLKTAAQTQVEQVKGQERQDVEKVKGDIRTKLKADVSGLPKEGIAELNQRLGALRAVYAGQAAMGLPVDTAAMQGEMEQIANEVIAKHKAGGAAPESKADLIRKKARELAAARTKK